MENKIMLPQIIGITGRKFNGKDTLGNYFVSKYGYKRMAFADALKNACREIFGFNDDQLYGDKKEEIDEYWGTSPRTIFQFVGTDLFRNQLENVIPQIEKKIWLKVIEKKILDEIKMNPDVRIVITDVRFINECDMIKKMGGIILRVKRNNINNKSDTHQSEIEIDNLNVNAEILNDGTMNEMFQYVTDFLIANSV